MTSDILKNINPDGSSDLLHDIKMQHHLPGMGASEKLESVAKSITPALGLQETSFTAQRWARNLGAWLEQHLHVKILREVDVPWQIGLNKHLFFFDDDIINAAIILGCAMAVISNFDLLLPMIGIGIFYVGSDKFLKKLQRL